MDECKGKDGKEEERYRIPNEKREREMKGMGREGEGRKRRREG